MQLMQDSLLQLKLSDTLFEKDIDLLYLGECGVKIEGVTSFVSQKKCTHLIKPFRLD